MILKYRIYYKRSSDAGYVDTILVDMDKDLLSTREDGSLTFYKDGIAAKMYARGSWSNFERVDD